MTLLKVNFFKINIKGAAVRPEGLTKRSGGETSFLSFVFFFNKSFFLECRKK